MVKEPTGTDKLLVGPRRRGTPDAKGLVKKMSNNYWVVYEIRGAQDTCDQQTWFINMDYAYYCR